VAAGVFVKVPRITEKFVGPSFNTVTIGLK